MEEAKNVKATLTNSENDISLENIPQGTGIVKTDLLLNEEKKDFNGTELGSKRKMRTANFKNPETDFMGQ